MSMEHNAGVKELNVGKKFSAKEFLLRWEMILLYMVILINVFVMCMRPNLYFAKGTVTSMLQAGMDLSFMGLGMYVLLGQGDRDISVGGLLLLVSMVIGLSYGAGLPAFVCIAIGLAVSLICQLISGILVAVLDLAAVIVAISMASVYRGIVKIVLGIHTLTTFPPWFTTMSWGNILGDSLPISMTCFVLAAFLFYLFVHKTKLGREMEIIGVNKTTAEYSGIRVKKIRIAGYLMMGIMVTISSIFFVGRLGNGLVSSAGLGYELEVMVIATLSRVTVKKRTPTVAGVVLATLLMTCLNYALSLLGIQANVRKIITGLILLASVAISQYNKEAMQHAVRKIQAGR